MYRRYISRIARYRRISITLPGTDVCSGANLLILHITILHTAFTVQ